MTITASYLRENLYSILAQAAKTGSSPEILCKGVTLRIVADRKPDFFQQLEKHPDILLVDPEDIVHMDWSTLWHNDIS